MRRSVLVLLLVFLCLLSACSSVPQETSAPTTEQTIETTAAETEPSETTPDIAVEKEVIVYFANWYLDTKTAEEGAEVCSIPWDKVTCINHAFWAVEPADGSSETSWERLADLKEPRTSFRVASTLPEADFENSEMSLLAPELPRNHFSQYQYYSELYPDVDILISIGGWTRSGYFSEMAYTAEGRASFVQSCLDILQQYPWVDGFDIDWEYFGGSKDGARQPESEQDQGCPIWGTPEEDSVNFAALAEELRQAMDAAYGPGVKRLTACASASTGWTLPCQNWRLVSPYMDYVNIMTYDMAGVWDKVTGHASKLQHVKDAVTVMNLGYGVELRKICVGSPMYGTDLKMFSPPSGGNPVGLAVESKAPCDEEITQEMLKAWEAEAVSGYTIQWEDGKPCMGEAYDNGGTGWHFGYDAFNRGAYLYNDDEKSEYYCWYISYENALTLQDKLDFIHQKGIAGLIVWECSQDTYDHAYISQMADNLLS